MASIWLVLPILAAATAWMYFLTLMAPKVEVNEEVCTMTLYY